MLDAILTIGAGTPAEQLVLSKLFGHPIPTQSTWEVGIFPERPSTETNPIASQLSEKIQQSKTRLFFLQGPAGTGKSHVAIQLPKILPGLALFGPLTVGPDTSFESVVGSIEKQDDTAQFVAGMLVQFATSTALFPVFFVNEANLLPAGFWNIIR